MHIYVLIDTTLIVGIMCDFKLGCEHEHLQSAMSSQPHGPFSTTEQKPMNLLGSARTCPLLRALSDLGSGGLGAP